MAEAISVNLGNGISVDVVPGSGSGPAIITIDDITILVKAADDGYDIDISHKVKRGAPGVAAAQVQISVTDVDPQEIEENQAPDVKELAFRRCIVCGGRWYCVTNACARTPCGWICDR